MSEHDVYSKCAKQVADLSSEIERLRAGLLAMQHEAAAQTMTDVNPNATRALAARFEQRCKALLGTADYEVG